MQQDQSLVKTALQSASGNFLEQLRVSQPVGMLLGKPGGECLVDLFR
jgi:hypothetical protein